MEDAEDKAKQIATLAEVKLVKSTYISEGAASRPITRPLYESIDRVVVETPVSPGELKITTHVQIAYTIV